MVFIIKRPAKYNFEYSEKMSNTETTTSQTQAQTPNDTVLTTEQDAEAQSPITRVVAIAIDHSEHSQQAFDWSIENFLRKESDLVHSSFFWFFPLL